MKNRIFITGRPGVGKTTILMKIVKELRSKNINVTGFYCPEIRKGTNRVGFKIVSISSGKEAILASTEQNGSVKIGKYSVVLNEEFVKTLEQEIFNNPQLIAIDEIGPMELSVPSLKALITRILDSEIPLFAVVHRSIKLGGEIYEITEKNRENLFYYLSKKVLELINH